MTILSARPGPGGVALEPDRPIVSTTRLQSASIAVLGGVALIVVLSWAFLSVVHVDDRYLVNADFPEDSLQGGNSSVWMAHARSVNSGVPYPPLYDGETYGGTRYAPLVLYLWAAAARLTGEYLVSGKLLAYLVALGVLALSFRVMRRLAGSGAVALVLTSTILVTIPGLVATASTPRGDALALLFQLAAVTLVARSTGRRSCAAAGALCALAVLSKLSALWAPLAIVVWLLFRDLRSLRVFLAGFLGLSLGGFGLFQILSEGRMLENLEAVLFADSGGSVGFLAPLRLIQLLGDSAQSTSVLVPFAMLAAAAAVLRREVTLYHLSLLCALMVTTGVLVDAGAQANHLIDVIVLVPIVVAELWSQVAVGVTRLSLTALAVALACLWGVGLSYGLNVQHDVRAAAGSLGGHEGRYDAHPLRRVLKTGDTVLAEDPYVPISLGQDPIVIDPWMLPRLARQHPGWVSDLARRVADREFDAVALAQRLETSDALYRANILGEPVFAAVCRSYRFAGWVNGYWLYAPAGPGQRPLARADAQGPNACSRLATGPRGTSLDVGGGVG